MIYLKIFLTTKTLLPYKGLGSSPLIKKIFIPLHLYHNFNYNIMFENQDYP